MIFINKEEIISNSYVNSCSAIGHYSAYQKWVWLQQLSPLVPIFNSDIYELHISILLCNRTQHYRVFQVQQGNFNVSDKLIYSLITLY